MCKKPKCVKEREMAKEEGSVVLPGELGGRTREGRGEEGKRGRKEKGKEGNEGRHIYSCLLSQGQPRLSPVGKGR